MGKGRNIFDYMMEHTDPCAEYVFGQPIVEISGQRRVLIENHQGVGSYGREGIRVNVNFGSICICGHDLEMIHMSKEQLVIYGKIDSVILQRRR